MTLVLGLTIIAGFYMAWNIGANDVSNAIGTSVGSKALTLKKAVILAGILEFCGAFFLGSNVSQTIQSGIVKPEIFQAEPMLYVYGMLAALIATGLWLHLASYLRLPVSTTHAIVGAIAGFGLVFGGLQGVYWTEIAAIIAGWVVSPIMSGIIAYCIFLILQKKIFYAIDPLKATKRTIPFFVFFSAALFTLLAIYKGLANLSLNIPFSTALLLAAAIGLAGFFIARYLIGKILILPAHKPYELCHPGQLLSLEKCAKHLERVSLYSTGPLVKKAEGLLSQVQELITSLNKEREYKQDRSIYFRIEKSFAYLQIISACLIAFAHGANDVANAIGPVAAILQTLRTKSIQTLTPIPTIVLFLGGIGIVIGLATWGWRVVETIGKKITELTPTRGFSAEFGAGITILLASKLGLPVSTTHALVGAVLGVGLARGFSSLNVKTLKDIFLSWIITIPACAFISVVFFYLFKTIFY